MLTIDGQGMRGVCFGDSGGPVMVIAADGTVRVAGDLSNGDGSCVGQDNYTRADVHRAWIEGFTGPTVVDPGGGGGDAGDPCVGLDERGRCDGPVARWCQGGAPRQRDCAACGQACDWVDDVMGFYCR